MSDPDQNPKRLTIRERDGRITYCACTWPCRRDVASTLIVFVIIAAGLTCVLWLFYRTIGSCDFTSKFSTLSTRILYFLVLGSLEFFFVLILAYLVLWLPYSVINQLSPKELLLEDRHLCHTVRLLGRIRRTRTIDFDRIMEIRITPSGSAFNLMAIYKMKLPPFIHSIAVRLNERLTRRPLGLLSAIPTRQEAEQIQFQLLEVMIGSPARRDT